jgi:hypothetical protein
MAKLLPQPDGYCVKCRRPVRNIILMSHTAKCTRNVGVKKTCGGGIRSANNVGDWAECPECRAEAAKCSMTCMCNGFGWILTRQH